MWMPPLPPFTLYPTSSILNMSIITPSTLHHLTLSLAVEVGVRHLFFVFNILAGPTERKCMFVVKLFCRGKRLIFFLPCQSRGLVRQKHTGY